MTDEATTVALNEFLAAAPDERPRLAPELVQDLGEARLQQILAATWDRVGSFVSVTDSGRGPHIVGTRGRVAVWAATGPTGRLTGLRVSRAPGARQSAPTLSRCYRFGWAAAFALCVGRLWTVGSVPAWASFALPLALLLVLAEGYGAPSRWDVPPWVRRVFLLGAAAGAVSALRLGALPTGGPGEYLGPLLALVVLGPLTGLLMAARRHRWETTVSVPLEFPCDSGSWYIAQGGGRGLNHHYAVPPQRGALDILKVGPRGTRSRSAPRGPADYACYGTPLFAPCAGTVSLAVDRYPDQVPGRPRYGPVFGNEVRIDTGSETVLLCHLRPGSVRVRTGDRVRAGDLLGEVGNSGNSTEPHLHLQAERDGVGLELRFTGVTGGLWRGRVLRQRRPADGPVVTRASPRRRWGAGSAR
ncbi:M23 family metallopeptidase [Streptacidiphilus sp. P02-A3a]|uniref:M23 family metallopeptidase n=1 Tax=Streptacidiphilus sp. P02-A3a TaxID=2704468 RepID=UPI0015F9B90B|nr:M23 family metallopeptidase [Streptacidiphilus sp. P02-A3a]QMU70897.1 M23 family metallopeptidase [Streptacidiphilus sp. P02-A3a]